MEPNIKLGQAIGNWKVIALNYYHPSCNEPYLLLRCQCGKIQPMAKKFVVDQMLVRQSGDDPSLVSQMSSCGCSVTRTGLTLSKSKLSESREKPKPKRVASKKG